MTRLHVFLLAAAVAALVVYGVFAERAAGAPVPSGFQPGYFTASSARLTAGLEPTAVSAISSSRWWVLAQSSSCLTAACDQNLLTTTDGGRSFSVIAPLPIADPVSIHAADDHDLFISSTHGGLWFSPDAGKSWRVVNPPGPHGRPLFAGTVQTSAGDAYVVAWSGNLTRILRASLAALSSAHNPGAVWEPLRAPPGTTMGLMVRGEPWLVLSQPPGYGFPRVYASTDGGESFHPTGATLPAIACSFDPTGAAIWAGLRNRNARRDLALDGRWRPLHARGERRLHEESAVSSCDRRNVRGDLQRRSHHRRRSSGCIRRTARPTAAAATSVSAAARPLTTGCSSPSFGRATRSQWAASPPWAAWGARPLFSYRLFVVTGLGTRYRQIKIR